MIAYADKYLARTILLSEFLADEILFKRSQLEAWRLKVYRKKNRYFKEMLDKLAVTPHILRARTNKSADRTIFIRKQYMSAEAKANMQRC